ncbi:hypothetical protein QBC47DRAFT_409662 [Echria macrotheca]|uniref:Rhodopsin domain-containing protein n=1 Tax=Echria macrotheca TaxID=438768 RepID=A0AAJ0F991_9PEZI|nr:hypothetical protein QBC47DRAFT_409662 [Echria macrotheca]
MGPTFAALAARQQPTNSPPIIQAPPPLTPAQFAALPHDNLGPHLLRTIWIMIGASMVFLFLRLYAKVSRSRGLWWDDHILIGAWVCITTESSLLTYATTLGYGRHIYDVPFDTNLINRTIMVINMAGTFSLVAATWSKTSFAFTLLRLTDGRTKVFVWFIIVSINVAMGLSALFVWISCRPLQKAWMPLMDGVCWPPSFIVNYNIFSAAYSAAMDIALALLPWKLIWGLQMKRNEKIGVAVAMSCGIFAGITAIIKTTQIPKMLSADPYDGITLFIWGNAESCVTIIAASIPILRVFAREVKTRYYTTRGGGDTQNQRDYGNGTRGGGVATTRIITVKDKLDSDAWSDNSVPAGAGGRGGDGRTIGVGF